MDKEQYQDEQARAHIPDKLNLRPRKRTILSEPSTLNVKNNDVNQCWVCLKKFSRSDTLIAHQRAVHGKRGVKCEACSKRFPTQQALERHWPTHHKQKCFKCSQCSMTYTRDDTLKLHMRRVHDTADFKSKCEQCGKVLSCSKSLKRHIRTVHEEARPYVCSVCPWAFKRADFLETHLKTHERVERDYSKKQ